MNTTEIFVEQVLVGFMVLLILGLPFLPEFSVLSAREWKTWQEVGLGAGLVGAAYLLGVVCDRAADTFIEDLDRHQRARFALEALIPTQTSKKTLIRENIILDPDQPADLFPEGFLKTGALLKGDALAEQMEYLKTRIRLSRALAVILPGITFALVLGAGRLAAVDGDPDIGVLGIRTVPSARDWSLMWLAVVPASYFGVFLVSKLTQSKPKKATSKRRQGFVIKAPRTDNWKKLLRYGVVQGYVELDDMDSDAELYRIINNKIMRNRITMSLVCNIFSSRVFLINYLFFIITASLTLIFDIQDLVFMVWVSSYILIILSGWTWWRISKTFRTLLQNFGRTQTTLE